MKYFLIIPILIFSLSANAQLKDSTESKNSVEKNVILLSNYYIEDYPPYNFLVIKYNRIMPVSHNWSIVPGVGLGYSQYQKTDHWGWYKSRYYGCEMSVAARYEISKVFYMYGDIMYSFLKIKSQGETWYPPPTKVYFTKWTNDKIWDKSLGFGVNIRHFVADIQVGLFTEGMIVYRGGIGCRF